MATLMDEILKQYGMTEDDAANRAANPNNFMVPRLTAGLPESAGAIRTPSFQRMMQAGVLAGSGNPARAAIGEQILAQGQSNLAQRNAAREAYTSSAPFYGEPEGLGRPTAADTFTAKAPMPDEVGFGYRPSMNPALVPQMPDEVGFQYRPSMAPALAPRMPDEVGFQYRPSMNPLANPALNAPVVSNLNTANRPAPVASSVTAPARQQGFFEQLFKGPQYQSNNLPVNAVPQGAMNFTGETMPSYINWGDPNSAADFFRADALLRQQNPSFFGLLGGNNG